MTQRFISVIEHPGHMWTDHLVIDTDRHIVMAKCSQQKDADAITAILNAQDKASKHTLLLEEQV